jgi:hypothetical protein
VKTKSHASQHGFFVLATARRLRLQALDGPAAVGLFFVDDAVVQAGRAALPEFDAFRNQAVAAPVGRTRWLVAEFGDDVYQLLFQCFAVGDRLALREA